jgi:hypothetical protein
MNFEELEKTWARQTVRGAPLPTPTLRDALVSEVQQRSRGIRRLMGVAAFAFATGWAVALVAHVTGIKPLNGVALLGFVVLSAFELTCFGAALHSLRRMQREALSMGETLADSLRSSLRAVDWQLQDCVRFGYAVGILLLSGIVLAIVKTTTGSLPLHGLIAEIAVSLAAGAGVGATVRNHYRKKLVPRRDELRRELAELEQ